MKFKIPEDWEIVKLNDVCELIRGTEPGSKSYNTEGIGIRFIRVSDISKQVLEGVFINEANNLVICKKEDILLALDGVPGVVAKGFEGAISSGIRIVKPKTNKIDKEFLFYILQHKIVQKVIKNYTTGTTIKHASRAVDFIVLPLPPLPEQKAIAEILSTVDKTIQKVDEIIAKTERLKKGLMQKLLTKGIGHKEFKDTEIGRIPKEWRVVRVEEVAEVKGRIGWRGYKKTDFVEPGIGAISLGADNITEDNKLNLEELTWISLKKYEESPEIHVKFGDIIMAQRGSLGKVAIIDKDVGKATINPNVVLIKNIEVNNFYLYYVLASPFIKKCILAITSETTVPLLTQQQIRSLKIPVPPILEQQKIAGILSTVDKKLELERKRKEKLERIKKGLMDLLLTGKIRIKNPRD